MPDALPADATVSPAFTAKRSTFFWLLLKNMFLTALTLGIYRFWAKTKVRHYLWHNTQFLGDPLEYIGTAKELLFGFLVVIAILFPLGMIYGAIGLLVPPDMVNVRIGLEVVYYLALFILIQIGFYRMWRYRLSRTMWRGVRFGLDGSAGQYLKLSTGWSFLTLITLGLAYPWMQADLWRYRVQHARFGASAFEFEGAGRGLLVPWLAVLVPGWIYLAASAYLFSGFPATPEDAEAVARFFEAHQVSIAVLFAVTGFALIAFAWFRVRQMRFFISGLRLGGARFTSTLRFAPLVGYGLLSFAAAALLTAAALAPVFVDAATGSTHPGFATLTIPGVIVAVLGIPLIFAVLLGFEGIRQTVITTRIDNPAAIEDALQRHGDIPEYGEGLADALDIGAI